MIIYKITNLINGKVYIGQTRRLLSQRWSTHLYASKNDITNKPLYSAIKKHGKENFTIEEIDGANSLSELNYLEQHYIYMYNSLAPNGYNLTTGGGCFYYSDQSKKKMSESAAKKIITEEHKLNISKSLLGNKRTLGYIPTQETRQKLSESGKNRKHSEETKRKIAESKIGKKRKPFSDEWKNNLSKANIRRYSNINKEIKDVK